MDCERCDQLQDEIIDLEDEIAELKDAREEFRMGLQAIVDTL